MQFYNSKKNITPHYYIKFIFTFVTENKKQMINRIIDTRTINDLKQTLDKVGRVVITCHKKPDGDAIGSTLALCGILRNMGKNAIVIIPDQLPHNLSFMIQGWDVVTFTHSEQRAGDLIRNTQLIMSLDYNDFDRTGGMSQLLAASKAPKVLIDHHLNPKHDFDVKISHPEISSTSELVYRVACEAGWEYYIDRQVASAIFVGIMTDTGNLAFSSFYPEVYEVMARLMEYGINKPMLYKKAMDTVPLNSLRLQSHALLNRMTIIDDSIALITLDANDLAQFDYKSGDTERLVNRPLSVESIYWSVFMREDPDCIKVSMRSEGDFCVDSMCEHYFNGGGHAHAAAGEFKGTMQQAVDVFYQIIDDIKKQEIPKNQKTE